jgi:hypothetical protein
MRWAMIVAIAERWVGLLWSDEYVEIEKKTEGIFLNGEKVKSVMFNTIQLRLTMPSRAEYILIDGRTESDISIEDMHAQLSE